MFLFSLFLLLVVENIQCKPDYIYNYRVSGWLKLHRIPATWYEAYLRCHFEGAVLASPVNKVMIYTLEDITEFENKQFESIHLGTHAQFSPGDFFSIEGIPLADMPIKWEHDYPGTGDCLAMRFGRIKDYTMFTTSCEESRPYICYKKREELTKLNECGTFDNEYKLNNSTGSCYKLHKTPQTWSRAHMICAAEGGHLVILNDEQEAMFIKNMVSFTNNSWNSVFIGVRDLKNDSIWLTIHGEGLDKVYHNWAPGQPDNYGSGQHCGALIRSGAMDVSWCSQKNKFVCEKDPNTKRFESGDRTFHSCPYGCDLIFTKPQ